MIKANSQFADWFTIFTTTPMRIQQSIKDLLYVFIAL